ncbi:MAG TPA: FAD-dependent oxidoreductase [Candidatus Polarisedimenticolia bacterium]|nr:FAD-dependent oxidoreductase [Candidatus Polarisedimenticolia bacterium]
MRQNGWTRRDLTRLLLLSAALPARLAGAAPRRRVGIVGGGMAGVALAWLLDAERDVVLFEARDAIGGNVQSVTVELDGVPFVVDLGAQYFHPGPYPLYSGLLQSLGLFDPAQPDTGATHAFPASITLFAGGEPTPRFLSPAVPGRAWPLLLPWNRPGIAAFATAFAAARRREREDADWTTTLGEWLPTIAVSPAQRDGMILPWAASLFSGRIDETRDLSARAAMVFAARALSANPLAGIAYDVLRRGMIEVLEILASQCASATFMTGTAVESVERSGGGFVVHTGPGAAVPVDDLVLAASGPTSLRILRNLPGAEAQAAALEGIAFYDTRIAIHAEPTYLSARPAFGSFFNARIDGDTCEASMAMRDVLADAPAATAARIFKSWVTHRAEPPGQLLRAAEFRHMLPSAATIRAQMTVASLQGRDGVWLAGGYLHPYDAQETALLSAMRVAQGLEITSARLQRLAGASGTVARPAPTPIAD